MRINFLSQIEPLEARIAPAAAVFELASLDGSNGFQISGAASRDFSGSAVSDAGDVNGDGFGDLIISAPGAGAGGAAYVVFGKAGGFTANQSVSALTGGNGFSISGLSGLDYGRTSVSAAGDVNGDGFDDLIVGASQALARTGASFVIFGKASGFAADLNVSTLNGTNGFKLTGGAGSDEAGIAVSAAGDVNGDGLGDILVGAHKVDANGYDAGATYVVFGKRTGFSANLGLSTLNGTNGFKLSGVGGRDYSGYAVSAAGDMNGDGFGDLIIGAPEAEVGTAQAGASYVVFGKAAGFAANLNLSALNGTDGFRLSGVTARDYAGFSVSAAGDVNGDGFDDVIVGAYGADPNNSTDGGTSYVVFGKATAFAADVSLATLNGSNGFKLHGVGRSGSSVSSAGDFNGDGFDDLIIGQRTYSSSSTFGTSYVVFGKVGGFAANLSLSSLDGSNGFRLRGAAGGDRSGAALSSAGDVNGDGFDDLIVGAPSADPIGYDSGASFVVFGSASGPFPSVSISDVTVGEPASGTVMASFTVTLSSASSQTATVQYATADGTASAPGDYAAVALTTLTFAPGETSKTVSLPVRSDTVREADETFFVNLSNPTNATLADAQGLGTILDKSLVPLSSLNGSNGFKLTGVAADDRAGRSVSEAGDVNGDGFADVIIGAQFANSPSADSGASYVVFGNASAFSASASLATLNGSNGFKVSGAAMSDGSGASVSAAGDVNGDGFDDLIIGAPGADPNGYGSGASYVVFGKASGFAANLDVSTLDGSNGFRLSGSGNERAGQTVSSAGDLNGDGFDDLLVGAPQTVSGSTTEQAGYVVFGKASGFAANLNLSTLDGSNGFKLIGAPRDLTASRVSAAGDVNGDGLGDVIIGAWLADTTNSDSGAAYVLFGKTSAFAASVNLSTLNGSDGFKLSGFAGSDHAGYSVSAAGDVNGDGFGDVIVGANNANPNGFRSGASYVVFGRASGFAANLSLGALNGSNGFKLNGVAIDDRAGGAVSGAGDFNGDGFDDLIIGAHEADPNGERSGASYVVFGKAGGFPVNFNLSALNGSNGFKLNGTTAFEYAGVSVSAAGDVNGDGFDDVIIGAANSSGSSAGASYVVFGIGVEVSIGDAVVSEGEAGTTSLQFAVTLSEAGNIPVTVQVGTRDGSAVAGSDYALRDPVTLTFAPGELSKTVTVDVLGETMFEGDETFSVLLSAATGGVIRDGTGMGTIRNDDAPPVVSITGGSRVEGHSGTSALMFTVSLSAASGLPASVQVGSVEGTALAGSDFTALVPGTLTFAPGETTKTISVEVLGDVTIEETESFSVVLSGSSGATLGTASATGTILNDDTAVRIEDASSVIEGDAGTSAVTFQVSLEKASAVPVTVNFASADGTANAGSDFTAVTPGMLTFAPGETTKTITVEVLGDTSMEDHESFSLVLADPTNAVLARAAGVGTILNDDTALRIVGISAREGDSGVAPFNFSISLEAASALPVTVNYATADGTASAGSDYEAAPVTQLTFAPGETRKTVVVNVLGDSEVEAHETFAVILSAASGAAIADGTATGTILNDETRVRIADTSVLEGHSGPRALTFTVSLSAASALPVSVSYTSTDGTATAGADYTAATPGVLTFEPGETTKTLTLEALGDTAAERSETVSIGLADATNAVIDDGMGLGTILDDDVRLTGKRTATFKDVDGDRVTITVSTGKLKVGDFTLFPSGSGSQLALVDFRGDAKLAGADLSITATTPRRGGGDGLVHVGFIDATGIDLGTVRVKGDLGQVDAGDERARTPGLLSLTAQSIGRFGEASQLPGGSLQSDITGGLNFLKLADGLHDAVVWVSGNIGAVKVKGDVRDSAIRSDGKIGAIEITGDLAGSAGAFATISARGALAPTSNAKAVAIGSITIGGSVERAEILAGYDQAGVAVNGAAGIGSVFVGIDWSASSVVAGARAGEDGMFGNDDDAPIFTTGGIVAKIASIVIKGAATGSAASEEHFGFVAREIGFLKAGGTKTALTPGAGNDLTGQPVGSSANLRVREVA